MISRFFTTAIVITTPSTNPTNTTATAEGLPVVASPTTTTTVCHVQPYRPEGEQVLGVEEAQRTRRVWLPAGTPITHKSTAVIGGTPFQVAGDPDTWQVGSSNDHIECLMTRAIL